MTLSRDQILEVEDLDIEEVEVPEWGGSVLIKALSGTERDAYEASVSVFRGNERLPDVENARAKLVVRVVVDDEGNRIFQDEDIAVVGGKSSRALDRIFEAAAKQSGLSEEESAEAKGNSDAGEAGDSTSS